MAIGSIKELFISLKILERVFTCLLYTSEEVEKIKKEINATANTDIYRIEEEPGGRKILQVKPEIQFNVDLAGIIKSGKPEENELNEILKKMPNSTGIWISNQSRETFLGLLKNNGIRKF